MTVIVALGQAVIRAPVSWPAETRATVAGADAVFCNFEGCVAPPGAWPMKTKTVHPAHRHALAALRDLGVTHLSIANNHVWDFGHAGILETRRAAEAAGFAVAGAGRDRTEAGAPALAHGLAVIAADLGPTPDWAVAGDGPGVNPLRTRRRLALPAADIARLRAIARATGEARRRARRAAIGYDAAPDGAGFYGLDLAEGAEPAEIWESDDADFDRLAQGIGRARETADRVAVSLHYHHWASDWTRPPDWLEPLAARLIAAGADAVLGHGPPVAYRAKALAGGAFAPGLGNLVFHTARANAYDREGLDVWTGRAVRLSAGVMTDTSLPAQRPPG